MILKGIYLGADNKPYDFVSADNKHLVGDSNNAYLLVARSEVKNARDRVKKIKLDKDYVPTAKLDSEVEFNIDIVGKNYVLISEVLKK